MPKSVVPLWLLTTALLGLFPLLNAVYWSLELESGTLPPDGDSISIPIFNSVLLTIVVSPSMAILAWFCLRCYNPNSRLNTLRWDRPFRTVMATTLFGGAAALLILLIVMETLSVEARWYDHLWSGYFLLWVLWLLSIRAAVIDQKGSVDR
jgi:small-conductance mechanosensitive channel